ncbi:3-dehydroquinate synthase [Anaerolinea thermophila]|uniref:3-dehydroquinate synthase n=3 Tax=Anaerolinea TaxID=233189 RepID=UPI0026E99794|nr:3-dehydroquinate synthase [Anaerolinea thermophila]
MSAGEWYFIYGMPGAGKSTLGKALAEQLELPFFDLDAQIVAQAGVDIPTLFAREGESGFRARERETLRALLMEEKSGGVAALGGGALLNEENRHLVESHGTVLCLRAETDVLQARMTNAAGARPLVAGEDWRERLRALLERRAEHYASFPLQLDTSHLSPEKAAAEARRLLGAFRLRGMGAPYDVRVLPGGLDACGSLMRRRGLNSPVALVSDTHVMPVHGERLRAALEQAGYRVVPVTIPAGEEHKTLPSLESLWSAFLAGGLERGSTVVALGGGVIGDLAGFAAATFMRGIRWVSLPTSLLAMVDASLGGKTGADLPQGKNLIGAFHPPALVLADPETLNTLPEEEVRAGLAEVVKHGILADPALFALCEQGWEAVRQRMAEVIRRGMAVKVGFIERDPYEKGERAALNLGHTVGHAIERASGYRLRHGEAVAIGLVVEAQLAERHGIARKGLAERIAACLRGLGLPERIPAGLDEAAFHAALQVDKKNAGGRVRFALPEDIGAYRVGVALEVDWSEFLAG